MRIERPLKWLGRPGLTAPALAAALLAALPGSGMAAGAADRIFATGPLEAVAPGTVLAFSRSRTVPEDSDVPALDAASVTVTLSAAEVAADPAVASVSFDHERRRVTLPPVPVTAAHPALLVFLETTVGALASVSGGSPFYIKNRLIESFQQPGDASAVPVVFEGAETEGERLAFRPFENDPNGDKLGALQSMEIAFVLADGVPGTLYAVEVDAGSFTDGLTLEAQEDVE